MEKEELERELEKAEKGCVITVINQSSLPLSFDGSRHAHGKFKVKPPKTIVARETASFSLEGKKSIEASVKFRWGKVGRLELFWNMPEQGDPKIFYSAAFGRIMKFIFLVDEKPSTPLTPQELSSHSNQDTNDDVSSENISDGENEMNRSNSNGDIPVTPKNFDPNQLKSPAPVPKDDDDDSKGNPSDTNSFGFSSDEEDEPKRINIRIKPLSEVQTDILVSPAIGISAPPVSGPPSSRRRSNTKSQRESTLFGDLGDVFQQTNNAPVLSPTPPPASPPRERRLSMSGDFERNKFANFTPPNASTSNASTSNASNSSRNSLPLDGLLGLTFPGGPQLTAPPHLNTPPLTPTQPSNISASHSFSFSGLSPSNSTSPTPLSRKSSKGSFDLGRISFEDLRTLSPSNSSGPNTPKPPHTPDISLAPRPASTNTTPQFTPVPSLPKSPPIISGAPTTNSGAVLIPTTKGSSISNISPAKPPLGQNASIGTPPGPNDSPARNLYGPPLSPQLQRTPSGRNIGNGTATATESPNRHPARRYSEPPPVDLNLLFPEIATAKEKNKKTDVLEPAQKYMLAAMTHLEKNSIAAALGNLDLCISLLGTIPESTAQELEYSVRYRMFFVLLKEIAKPKPPMEHAFLSFFLSDLAVKPYHRVVAIRMAIRHNLTSQNFGVAAGLIQFLIERIHPVDESLLQEKLRKCMSQGRSNSDQRFKYYTCPACEQTASLSSSKCSVCQYPVKFCALTLEIIGTKAYYSCKLCKLNFSRKSISPRDSDLKCPFCKVGDLSNKIFAASK